MLFPPPADVPVVWSKVCHATVAGELGIGAKIAQPDHRPTKLICVYTHDFADMDDIKRVLRKLNELKTLTKDPSKSIWYKADAYTHLGIESRNQYGIKASLYGSYALLNEQSSAVAQQRGKKWDSRQGKALSPFASRKRKASMGDQAAESKWEF